MSSISNEFVTIEYKNIFEKATANCFMKYINLDKKYYKGLLNGIEVIHAKKLNPLFCILDKTDESKTTIIPLIEKTILGLNNIKANYNYKPANGDIYDDITMIISRGITVDNENKICYELARDYYEKTKDFSYLKKFFFDMNINYDDLYNIIDYNIENHLDDLLVEKIARDKYALQQNPEIYENLEGVINIVNSMHNIIIDNALKTKESMDHFGANVVNPFEPTKISDDECDKLTEEALVYIDPTNKLLEEYFELKNNNLIVKNHTQPNKPKKNYFDLDTSEIILTRDGNLADVLTFVHELGHYHHFIMTNEKSYLNPLFREYPSIYFELKTAEFLIKKGYSKEEIEIIKSYRTLNNEGNNSCLLLVLSGIYDNKNNERDNYDLSRLHQTINNIKTMDRDIDISEFAKKAYMSEEETKNKIDRIKKEKIYNLFISTAIGTEPIVYLIGTYLAEFSMNSLKHEDVLATLKDIMVEKNSAYNILKKVGLNPEPLGFKPIIEQETEKAKEKKITKKSDK